MAAGKVDDSSPSSQFQYLPPQYPTGPFLFDDRLRNSNQYFRSVSSNDQRSAGHNEVPNEVVVQRWRTAMQCKLHVGTQEWVKCTQDPCVELKCELHHLLECGYKPVGGCEERCHPLRKELRTFIASQPKYPTISQFNTHQSHKEMQQHAIAIQGKAVQVKLQALNIEKFVSESTFSPNSPQIEEPFQILADKNREVYTEKPIEIVPVDKTHLSVVEGRFRRGQEWERLAFLGKGTFGTTYLCYDINNSYHFAIKKLREKEFDVNEVEIWQGLNDKQHANILKLFGAVQRNERVLIFMEYMNGGSVGDFLSKHGTMMENTALQILHQVLNGLSFMHTSHVVHGDIKGANVLMDELGLRVKLADFGSCVNLDSVENGTRPKLAGTLAFMAPEICRSEFPSFSADIWSVMCFLIQMLTGEPPWAEYRHQANALNPFVIGSAQRGPILPECSTPVQDLFSRGFRIKACSRPTAAELLLHRAFHCDADLSQDFSRTISCEVDDEWSEAHDVSQEYHSGQSSCNIDSGDEYLTPTGDCGTLIPFPDFPLSAASSAVEQAPSLVIKHVSSKGSVVSLDHISLTIPAGAVHDPLQITIRCVDPVDFFQPLINFDLYETMEIVGHVHHFGPSPHTFAKPVAVKLTLAEQVHPSEPLAVFYGTLNTKTRCITWKDISDSCIIIPFTRSFTVDLNVDHFSSLMVLKIKNWSFIATEFLFSYSTMLYTPATLFRFLVLVRDDSQNSVRDVRCIMVRESFYLNSRVADVDQFSLCRQLRDEGFRVMYGTRREYSFAKETLKVSLATGRALASNTHVVTCLFGGEEISHWKLECREEMLTGTVTIERETGVRYLFQIWEHGPVRYVQNVLQLSSLTVINTVAIGHAAGLSQEQIKHIVEELCGKEEEQLRKITQLWETRAENNNLGSFREFVNNLSKSDILVSDRGKFHVGHLAGFKEKWDKKEGRKVANNAMFFAAMAKTAKDLCQSVFSDCLLQLDHSEDTLSRAANVQRALELLLEHVKQRYPRDVQQMFTDFLSLLSNENITCDAQQALCQHLYSCIPWLTQLVKDLFKVAVCESPIGLWGLATCDSEKNTEATLSPSEAWCRICEVLFAACEANLEPGTEERHIGEIVEMEQALDVIGILEKITISDNEWDLLKARVKYYRKFVKEITRDGLCETLREDLHNVLVWLQHYVKFCPRKLVQFRFNELKTRRLVDDHTPLRYDQESSCFTQTFTLTNEDGEHALGLHVNINGFHYYEDIDVAVTRCEEDSCKTLQVIYHHDKHGGAGLLKVLNQCNKVFVQRNIESHVTSTDGSQEPLPEEGRQEELLDMARTNDERVDENLTTRTLSIIDGNQEPLLEERRQEEVLDMAQHDAFADGDLATQTLRIKEGCPTINELEEIAHNIPDEWKTLGRNLLNDDSLVSRINMDEPTVADKAMKMLKTWKQKNGSDATYEVLYDALCSPVVGRRDFGEKYCLVSTSHLVAGHL